jgi:cytochrome c biogenesis protein CcmG, thiol:disulfide interchange protein DsbE
MNVRTRILPALLACVLPAAAMAQSPSALSPSSPSPSLSPSPQPAAKPAPPDDVRMIRYKISAGDLPSAESILETHRAEKGEDTDYLLGLAWVARGAALTGDWNAATSHARAAWQLAESKLKAPADYANAANREAVYALGTAIEVQAQAFVAAGKKSEAIRFLDDNERSHEKAPYNLRARIWKRRNQIELVGQKAPEIRADDHIGAEPPTLESLRGKPVVLYFWWEACGDCKAQAVVFRKVANTYAGKGVAFLAPTRFYDAPEERAGEKSRIEKSWKDVYGAPTGVTVPISDSAMLRYGVSATPTFALVDRKGVVTMYSPTRMTEERLSAAIDTLLRP